MLELDFDVEPDANGIFDGRELAHALVQAAYALLAPYVNACPACTDTLFSAVANTAIAELQGDAIPGRIMNMNADGDGHSDGAAWKRHRAETDALTTALLSGNPGHIH